MSDAKEVWEEELAVIPSQQQTQCCQHSVYFWQMVLWCACSKGQGHAKVTS